MIRQSCSWSGWCKTVALWDLLEWSSIVPCSPKTLDSRHLWKIKLPLSYSLSMSNIATSFPFFQCSTFQVHMINITSLDSRSIWYLAPFFGQDSFSIRFSSIYTGLEALAGHDRFSSYFLLSHSQSKSVKQKHVGLIPKFANLARCMWGKHVELHLTPPH